MNCPKMLMVCIAGLALHGTAGAQIYESRDAEGNPVFTDQPSAGAERIQLEQTNIASPPPDIPAPPKQRAVVRHPSPERSQQGEQEHYYIGSDEYDDFYGRLNAKERREQRRPGDREPVVGVPVEREGGEVVKRKVEGTPEAMPIRIPHRRHVGRGR